MAEWGKISSLFRLEKVLRPEQFDATSMVTLPKIKDFTLPAVKILCLREPNEIVNVCWFYAVVVV